MARREFTKSTKVAIIKRATVGGVTRCEECRCAVVRFEIHHRKEDALEIDKSAKLTADDGLLLCYPCHDELTRPFQTVIAKVRRIEAKHLGVRSSPAFQSRKFAEPAPKNRSMTKRANGERRLYVNAEDQP